MGLFFNIYPLTGDRRGAILLSWRGDVRVSEANPNINGGGTFFLTSAAP